MTRYTEYRTAAIAARALATAHGIPVAIRRTREYGRDGYTVSFAHVMDSDDARAEIVKPGEPKGVGE